MSRDIYKRTCKYIFNFGRKNECIGIFQIIIIVTPLPEEERGNWRRMEVRCSIIKILANRARGARVVWPREWQKTEG